MTSLTVAALQLAFSEDTGANIRAVSELSAVQPRNLSKATR